MNKNYNFFKDSTWQVLVHCERCGDKFDKSKSESKHICNKCLDAYVKEMKGDQV